MTIMHKVELLKKLYDPNLGMDFYNKCGVDVIKMIDESHLHCRVCQLTYDAGISWTNIADFDDETKKISAILCEDDIVEIAFIGVCPTCHSETKYKIMTMYS